MRRRAVDPTLVTSAPLSLEQERQLRQNRYMWTMGLRTLMFIVAIAVPMPVALRIAMLAASIVVPWLAVMAANQPSKRVGGRPVAGYAPAVAPPVEIPRLDPTKIIDGDAA